MWSDSRRSTLLIPTPESTTPEYISLIKKMWKSVYLAGCQTSRLSPPTFEPFNVDNALNSDHPRVLGGHVAAAIPQVLRRAAIRLSSKLQQGQMPHFTLPLRMGNHSRHSKEADRTRLLLTRHPHDKISRHSRHKHQARAFRLQLLQHIDSTSSHSNRQHRTPQVRLRRHDSSTRRRSGRTPLVRPLKLQHRYANSICHSSKRHNSHEGQAQPLRLHHLSGIYKHNRYRYVLHRGPVVHRSRRPARMSLKQSYICGIGPHLAKYHRLQSLLWKRPWPHAPLPNSSSGSCVGCTSTTDLHTTGDMMRSWTCFGG